MKIDIILIVSLIIVVTCSPQGGAWIEKEDEAIKQLQDYIDKGVHRQYDLWDILYAIKKDGVLSENQLLHYSLLQRGKFDGKPKELAELIIRGIRVSEAIKLLLIYITRINEQGAYIVDPDGRRLFAILKKFNGQGVLSNEELGDYQKMWDGNIINKNPLLLARGVLDHLRNQGEDPKGIGITAGQIALFEEAINILENYQQRNWPHIVDDDGAELFKILKEFTLLGVFSDEDLKYYEKFRNETSNDPDHIANGVIKNIKEKIRRQEEDFEPVTAPPAIDIKSEKQCSTLKAIEQLKEYVRRGADTKDGDALFDLLNKFEREDVICRCELRRFNEEFQTRPVNGDSFKLAKEVIQTLSGPRYLECCSTDALKALNVSNTTGPAGSNNDEKAIKELREYIRKIENQGAKNYDPSGTILMKWVKDFSNKDVITPEAYSSYRALNNGKFKGNPKGLAEKVLNDIQVAYAVAQLSEYKQKNWPIVLDLNGGQLWSLLNNYKAQGFLHQSIYVHYEEVWKGRTINKNPYALATFVAVDINVRNGIVNGNAIGSGNANATKISHGKI